MHGREKRAHDAQVVRITTAPRSPADELDHRERRYLISMAVRTVCVVLAVVFRESWLMWVFIAGAVLLPYVAVVMANTADRREDGPALRDPGTPRGMLPPS